MNRQIEAINLMLKDLGLVDESLQHLASFHGFLLQRRHGAGGAGAAPQRTNSISW